MANSYLEYAKLRFKNVYEGTLHGKMDNNAKFHSKGNKGKTIFL